MVQEAAIGPKSGDDVLQAGGEAMADKKKWIQKARERMERKGTVGSLTRWCKRQGFQGVTCECIRKGLKQGGKIAKKAAFAKAVSKKCK